MRVLRITPLWDWRACDPIPRLTDPQEHLGGHAAQALGLTRAVARAGVEQTVVTLRAAGGPRRGRLAEGVEIRGVGRPGLTGTHRRNMVWLTGVLAGLGAYRREGFDVVHVHASGIVEPLWAAHAATAVLRRPLVLTLHHSAQATYVSSSRRDAAVQVLTRASERRAVRTADRTLALTGRTAERLTGGAIEVLPDSIDIGAFTSHATAEAGRALRTRLGIPEAAPVIVFAGRLSIEKGWRDLLRLESVIPDVHLIVCGDGPDRDEVAGFAGSRTHLLGAVGAQEVAAAMAGADVHVLPSVFEELGSVLIEAMACGVPSIAYDVGGVAEALVPGVTGRLVRASDAAGFASAVAVALGDRGLQAAARTEGPRIAREQFDRGLIGERLIALYDELAGSAAAT